MSVKLYINYTTKNTISKEVLSKILMQLTKFSEYTTATSYEPWKEDIHLPIKKAVDLIFKGGGAIFYFDFGIHYHPSKTLSLSPGSTNSLNGDDKEYLKTITNSIIAIAKLIETESLELENVSSRYDSPPEESGAWVCYFPDKKKELFRGWNIGKVVQLKRGVMVFINKYHRAWDDDLNAFSKFLKDKNIGEYKK